jgi:hypothetical protein
MPFVEDLIAVTGNNQFAKIKLYDGFGNLLQELMSFAMPLKLSYRFEGRVLISPSSDNRGLNPEEIRAAFAYSQGKDPAQFPFANKILVEVWDYLIFKDSSGIVFQAIDFYARELIEYPQYSPNTLYYGPYSIHPNEMCDKFHLQCKSNYYPGVVCKPIAPMANTIQKMNEKGFK